MSIEPQNLVRCDVIAIETILMMQPELYVNIVGEPCIGLPLEPFTEQRPWHLGHERVRAEIAGVIWEKLQLVLYDHELNRILRVLECHAWRDQRVNIDLKDAGKQTIRQHLVCYPRVAAGSAAHRRGRSCVVNRVGDLDVSIRS